jgi:probable phosphoglycerate mutase
MKEIILVRHGESEHLVKGIKGGWTDLPLTDKGRLQIKLTRKRLKELFENRIEIIYTSDLIRAKESAEIMREDFDIPLIVESKFRDINKGITKDMTIEEGKKVEIPPSEPIRDWIPYPEGENWRMLFDRVSDALTYIEQKLEQIVLIISHDRTIAAIIEWWLKLPEDSHIDFFSQPASITWLGLNDFKQPEIRKLNETAHLMESELK